MLRQLKRKFVCINMLIAASMLTVILGMVIHFTGNNIRMQNHQLLQQVHQMQMHKPIREPNIRTPYFMVQFGKQGTITISSSSFYTNVNEEKLLDIAKIVYNGEAENGMLEEHDLVYSRKRTPIGEQIAFIDISRDRVIMEDLLKTCGMIGFLSLCLFFAVSVGLAHWAVKPVDTAWKQQRQFVADASHELKTPLTVILTNAELLRSGLYDESENNRFIESIHTMSVQMRGLVEGLLDLARLDSGVSPMLFSEVDLSRLTESCLLPFEPVFFEAGFSLESRIEKDIKIMGSEPHLHQVVDILLDNALKYGKAGSGVFVSLHRQGVFCVLAVSGSGDPISQEDLKKIFQRFYRIDKARRMNHSYGLGLSIAQHIVQEHKGEIWAESENGENRFFVKLPIQR